ncbi:MAG: ATP-dependent helicase HrpB, partial [Sulfurovum sp.]|nr:ATP-dependent helicase HrpB [Sulfurovum sp.]
TTALSQMLDAPLVTSEGRAYPVERHYLNPTTTQPTAKEMPSYIAKRVQKCLEDEEGNILVFLAGVRQIKEVEKLLLSAKLQDVYIATLYGNLSKQAQDQAIKAPPKGTRKVVLSTNIAQTSLTIEGIKIVIDSGAQNVSVFSPFSGMNTLERRHISQDSATQRAGRAGRLSAGKAYHIWHKSKILQPHDTPELLQADLTSLILELALWGNNDIYDMQWLDTPPSTAINHAKTLLTQLGALDSKGIITAHGRAMSKHGIHPRLSHMMLKAKSLDFGYEASLLASLLTEKDIYTQNNQNADLRERVQILHDVAQKKHFPYVNIKQCHYILANAKRLESKQKGTLDTQLLGVLLAFAYPERIAKQRHANTSTYLLSSGKGAKLYDSELAKERFLVIADLDAKATHASIYKAIAISQDEIESHLPELITVEDEIDWNEEEQRVEVRKVSRLSALLLKESAVNTSNNEEITDLLLEELKALGLKVLNWDKETLALKNRVGFLNAHHIDFPDFSDTYLLENMDEWLAPYIEDMCSIRELKSLNLHTILLGQLSYAQTQTLDKLAPAKIKVASGSNIAIDYTDQSQPILAVRLQEMFGTQETPTLLNGKVKLMLHLLSPAHKPMQITQDIKSFWANTYADVKKDLRGKYKRHYWPDDPLEAQATSKTKKWM